MTAAASIASDSNANTQSASKRHGGVVSKFWNYTQILFDLINRCSIKPLISKYSVIEVTVPGKDALSVQYIGDGGQYSYVLGLLFEQSLGNVVTREHHSLSLLQLLRGKLPSTDAHISVLDFDFPLQRLLNRRGLEMPHWLKQSITLGNDWDTYLSGMRRKTRREAQRMIRKFDLTANVVAGSEYGAAFYDELYQPYISARHGDSSVIIDRGEFLAKIRFSHIMQLVYQGDVIAAAQIDNDGVTLALGWTGVADRDERDLRGAADALDYFCIKYAFDSGCKRVDMGHSRPVLSDGILRYKKKWRAALNTGVVPQGSLVFRANTLSVASRAFFQNNTLLTKSAGALEAHLLIEDDTASSATALAALLKDIYIDGLSKITVYSPQGLEFPQLEENCILQLKVYNDDNQLLGLLAGY